MLSLAANPPPGSLIQPPRWGPPGPPQAAAVGDQGAPSAGLVPLGTSDKGERVVTLSDLRMKRVRRGLLEAAAYVEGELQSAGTRYRAAMVTTTYAPGRSWSPRHLSAALKSLREWARNRRIWVKYVWRLEFTRAGVPHYHVVVWLPRGWVMPMWDRQGWWPHGMTNAKWARSPVGYLAKYASKETDWPPGTGDTRGARWFGAGGLGAEGRLRVLWRCAPLWLRELWAEGEPLRKLSGSWWRLGCFAEVRSPWRADLDGNALRLRFVGWTAADVRFC